MKDHILEFEIKQKNMFCFILIFMDYKQMNKKGFMRIPTNSNLSTEINKKYKKIFHRDMTNGE